MQKLFSFIRTLPDTSKAEEYNVYPDSVNQYKDSFTFMVREADCDKLILSGRDFNGFEGIRDCEDGITYTTADLNHINAEALRNTFSFTKPIRVLGKDRSAGVGDRLGIACPGHIRVFKEYDAYPVFAQQSIRELNLTNRTYEDVLDCVTFYVFRDGYKKGFGADGDHLKKENEIEYALRLGYTMITLDCSEHIKNDIDKMSDDEINSKCKLSDNIKSEYCNKKFVIEDDITVSFSETDLKRIQMIYGEAIDFAAGIYKKYFIDGKANADFEISIDETATPTSPAQHYFVANELVKRNVNIATMAPRFCGEFQKGVDYIGNLDQFENEMKVHAAIARHFGYKLSIHSGSDKFSTFKIIGKYTRGRFHLKTAGTNWLEAMKAVSVADPSLYREVHKYALTMFNEATKYYHVTTDLNKIPNIDTLKDEELPKLFEQNDVRQLIHITYGFILSDKDENGNFIFKDRLYKIWRDKELIYSDMLYNHIGKHLRLLYEGAGLF